MEVLLRNAKGNTPLPNNMLIPRPTTVQVQSSSNLNTLQPTTTMTSNSPSNHGFHLHLSRLWFVVAWWLVAALRGCEIAFLTATMRLYYWILTDVGYRNTTIGNLSLEFSYSTLQFLSWGFAVVDALHVVPLVRSLLVSFKAKELRFTNTSVATWSTQPGENIKRPPSWIRKQSISAQQWMTSQVTRHKWITRVFCVDGDYFDVYCLISDCVEVASQIYQGYQMSVLNPRRWINHVMVLMIFMKCISTPIINYIVPPANVPLRRLLCILCSAFLNFVNSVVIPFIVFLPYVQVYDTSLKKFPRTYTLDDVWSAKATRENQQLFVTSYPDFFATWMPHWSLFLCLFTCEDLIRRTNKAVAPVTSSAQPVPVKTKQLAPSQSRVPPATQQRRDFRGTAPPKRHAAFLYHGLWIVGVIVLGIHVASQSPQEIKGCKLTSTAWFAAKSSCVIMNINCYSRGIDGTAQQLSDILDLVNPQAVFQLQISHCPYLQIPPGLRDLHSLGGLNIYNCTLNAWPAEASVNQANHPKLTYVSIFRTKVPGVPPGLMDDQIPSLLSMIYFFDTNLTSLPDNLHEKWPSIPRIGLEFCRFEQFPAALSKMRPTYIILTGSLLQADAALDVSVSSTLLNLWLSKTPITALPNSTMGKIDKMTELELEFTLLKEVPAYVRVWYLSKLNTTAPGTMKHSLYGSPYCNVTLSHDDVDQQRYQKLVCAKNLKTSAGRFDIQSIANQRLLT